MEVEDLIDLSKLDKWKVLIANANREAPSVTKYILKDYRHKNRPLEFFDVHDLDSFKNFLRENRAINVILLDLSLVDNDCTKGIELIKYVREELNYKFIRFIIKKGEFVTKDNEIISNHEIYEDFENDCDHTTEMTIKRFPACMATALRSYEDLITITNQRKLLIAQSKLATMGEMIDSIAHQWTQPLTSINLIGLSLNFQIENDMNVNEMTNLTSKLFSQVEHLKETLQEFRGFFRPNKKKRTFSINEVIDTVLVLVNDELIKNKIKIEVKGENVTGYGFANELKHVILNLITNAKDEFKDEKQDKLIVIETKNEENKSIITVLDNAGGVPTHILPKVFKPNFTTKGESGGTGIGLYLSKIIIEDSMHGEIYVENENSGAKFTIAIPKE